MLARVVCHCKDVPGIIPGGTLMSEHDVGERRDMLTLRGGQSCGRVELCSS